VKRKPSSASKKATTRKVATKKSVTKKGVIKKDVAKKSAAKKSFNPTPTSVTRLRKRLGLTQTQFAKLLGVSLPSVYNWENALGKLDLRDRSRKALNRVAELTQDEVLEELGRFG
jgi:DNA-binding transcriptional regulator YiaG